MGIDAGIIGGLRPMQIEPPTNALAKILELQNAQQAGQMNAMKMDEYRRGLADENQLRDLTRQSGGDVNKLRDLVYGAGNIKRGMELDKTLAEQKKAGADLEKTRLEAALKKLDIGGRILGSVTDPTSYERARVAAKANGLGDLPPQYDPAFVQETIDQGVDLKTKYEQKWKAMEYTTPNANARLTAETSTDNNKRTVAASRDNAQATRDAARTTGDATRDAARIQTGFQNEQGLRKEFEALPEVKKYKQALPSYKGIEDAVKRNTAQSDINIVYGIAKLYDPDSVVREGEYATVANSPNIPDRIKGYAQYLAGGGRLTDKVKGEILAEAKSRMKSYEDQHSVARQNFESIASRSGVDVSRVFPSPVKPAVKPETKPAANIDALLDKYK
jgi:hypothetical protein